MDLETFVHHLGERKAREVLYEECGEDLKIRLAEGYAEPAFDEEAAIEKDREGRLG